jgi:pyroglutamyl-peptidase
MSDLLVTGFLAFGRFATNPSALLAASLGRRYELLTVSYAAVDAFLDRVECDRTVGRLLMLGVCGDARATRIERFGRNHVAPPADVTGEVRGPGPIDPVGPPQLAETLFGDGIESSLGHLAPQVTWSDDAGSYLCNYALFRALRRLPHLRVGFVHVPPIEAVPHDLQRSTLARLINANDRAGDGPPRPR